MVNIGIINSNGPLCGLALTHSVLVESISVIDLSISFDYLRGYIELCIRSSTRDIKYSAPPAVYRILARSHRKRAFTSYLESLLSEYR